MNSDMQIDYLFCFVTSSIIFGLSEARGNLAEATPSNDVPIVRYQYS